MRTHGARKRAENARRADELRKEREAQHKKGALGLLQRWTRGMLVRRLALQMKDLTDLRKALHTDWRASFKAEEHPDRMKLIRDIVARIEASPHAQGALGLRALFFQEVVVARGLMRLIEIQETHRRDIEAAIRECDVVELNKLLVRADRLDMAQVR